MNTFKPGKNLKDEVRRIQLEMLDSLLAVCRNNQLRCFADGGTLLGAVRHKGFIPWDDDIDIIMFREDYDKLLQIGKRAFQPPIFFQTYETDTGYFHPHIQLRYMGTTAMLLSEKDSVDFNQGIFIDVFPLDGVPANGMKRLFQWCRIQVYRKLSTALGMRRRKGKIIEKIVKKILPGRTVCQLQNSMNNECRKYMHSELMTLLSINMTSNTNLLRRSWYEEALFLPFENLQVPAPKQYEKVLQVKYGRNYMIPRKTRNMHGEVLFDPYNDYTKYKTYLNCC